MILHLQGFEIPVYAGVGWGIIIASTPELISLVINNAKKKRKISPPSKYLKGSYKSYNRDGRVYTDGSYLRKGQGDAVRLEKENLL